MHFKGLELWALVDLFSVMVLAMGFIYTAYKTRALSGIIGWVMLINPPGQHKN